MQVRVELDVRKPLRRETKVRLHDDVQLLCPLRCERFQTFCYICGIMGHTEKYCEINFRLPAHQITRRWDDSIRAKFRDEKQKLATKWLKNPTPAQRSSSNWGGGGGGGLVRGEERTIT
ncbi:hypothetical protein LINGRAHAP2_LOCUS8168 [Linum grandiflorum]